MTEKEHIMKSFDEELRQLKETVIEMMRLAARQVADAMEALTTGDEVLAAKTIAKDARINRLQEAVDACTLRLLAMRQPVANDLRFIMAAHRMADDLERIADYAVGVSRRTLEQAGKELGDPVKTLGAMGGVALEMLYKVEESFKGKDLELAISAWRQDDEIDELYTEVIKELQLLMISDSECIEPCMAMLNAAKAIERIGDHTTNLSEEIYFAETGEKFVISK